MLYSPGTEVVATPQSAETKAAAVDPTPEVATVEVTKGPSLAETIRAEREAREASAKRGAEQDTLKQRAETAESKLASYEKQKENALLDSAGYLESLGFDQSQMAMFAENVMFTLVPDKAPPDHLPRMIKAQRARDQKLAEEKSVKERAEAETKAEAQAKAQAEQLELDYKTEIAQTIPTLTEDKYPDSVKWFGQDHADYAESLLHTARNLATEATRQGRQADLSPTNVAAVLEKHMAAKATRFRAPTQPAQSPAPVSKPSPAPAAQPGIQDKKVETKKAQAGLSEQERIARATAAAFPNG